MKKTIGNIIFIIYAIIAVFVTICLLSFNEYRVTEFGDTSLVIIDNEELAPNFNKGDLVLIDKSKRIREGDKIFFYNSSGDSVDITLANVELVEKVNNSEYTYTVEGEQPISSEYVLGKADDVTKISAIGSILGVLESKWGFLILIVFPSLLAFIYEITVVITELKEGKENEEDTVLNEKEIAKTNKEKTVKTKIVANKTTEKKTKTKEKLDEK